MKRTLIQILMLAIGGAYLLTAAATFLVPVWFFAHVAPFPPYNPHFLADIGAFTAPLGVALLIAARAPERHRLLIGLAALGTLLHAVSHLRDLRLHLPPHMPMYAGLAQEALIFLTGLALLGIAIWGARATGRSFGHDSAPDRSSRTAEGA